MTVERPRSSDVRTKTDSYIHYIQRKNSLLSKREKNRIYKTKQTYLRMKILSTRKTATSWTLSHLTLEKSEPTWIISIINIRYAETRERYLYNLNTTKSKMVTAGQYFPLFCTNFTGKSTEGRIVIASPMIVYGCSRIRDRKSRTRVFYNWTKRSQTNYRLGCHTSHIPSGFFSYLTINDTPVNKDNLTLSNLRKIIRLTWSTTHIPGFFRSEAYYTCRPDEPFCGIQKGYLNLSLSLSLRPFTQLLQSAFRGVEKYARSIQFVSVAGKTVSVWSTRAPSYFRRPPY